MNKRFDMRSVRCPQCGYGGSPWEPIPHEYIQDKDCMRCRCRSCRHTFFVQANLPYHPQTCFMGGVVRFFNAEWRAIIPVLIGGVTTVYIVQEGMALRYWVCSALIGFCLWWVWFSLKHTDWAG